MENHRFLTINATWSIQNGKDVGPNIIKERLKILNMSKQVPNIWKEANTVPIPKSTTVQNINQDLRPISLTPVLSKRREELKPAILKVLDVNQFGVIPGSSTSQGLIKLTHRWLQATDGLGALGVLG